jgi:hypothetical protein
VEEMWGHPRRSEIFELVWLNLTQKWRAGRRCKPGYCNATQQRRIFLSPCGISGGKKPRGFGLLFARWSQRAGFWKRYSDSATE